jgi:hypothetical protein
VDKLTGDTHAGDWRLHHISLPDGPGDFTPVRRDAHQEDQHSAFDVLLGLLAGVVPGLPERQRDEPEREAG